MPIIDLVLETNSRNDPGNACSLAILMARKDGDSMLSKHGNFLSRQMSNFVRTYFLSRRWTEMKKIFRRARLHYFWNLGAMFVRGSMAGQRDGLIRKVTGTEPSPGPATGLSPATETTGPADNEGPGRSPTERRTGPEHSPARSPGLCLDRFSMDFHGFRWLRIQQLPGPVFGLQAYKQNGNDLPLHCKHIIPPILAFCNAYGCGLTDCYLASAYGKVAIIIFSSWVGVERGGIIVGLASCGVIMNIISTASDLMAYPLGDPMGSCPAPQTLIYQGIALIGAEGTSSLPKHCVTLAVTFFAASVAISLIPELLRLFCTKAELYQFIPSPMCMAVPFYHGVSFLIDMVIWSLILYNWERRNWKEADDLGPAMACGFICGDSLWGVPAAVLSLAGVRPPICMKFHSASVKSERRQLFSCAITL
ncbi:hypothetical protein CRG98_024729 [Punica granatum]|uniref:Uncharacterized protein n=1 Tax=Punica granatum TaxID=22663 RepID=A0A2I0JGW0_PUNGR|nr:hypothetical protein CRG98_024729 [Punica granatum]